MLSEKESLLGGPVAGLVAPLRGEVDLLGTQRHKSRCKSLSQGATSSSSNVETFLVKARRLRRKERRQNGERRGARKLFLLLL